MSNLEVLRAGDGAAWMEMLSGCVRYDFFHLPAFHALAEANGEGNAHLFVYREGPYRIVLPLLLRSLAGIGPAEPFDQDATSVYGYAGPLCSHVSMPVQIVRHFQQALEAELRQRKVVSVFSRLHPLLDQRSVLDGLGDCVPGQQTVSLDLTLSESEQLRQYRRNHSDGIRRLRKLGMACVRDEDGIYLADFMAIYHDAMRRLRALPNYFFPADYYRGLLTNSPGRGQLFVGRLQGETVCAAIILECNGIVQYYLGGSRQEYLKRAPMKLLIDSVRAWAHRCGCRVFHLGGGTTAQPDDSLLHFKKGFSDRCHSFFTWRWILRPALYERLCTARLAREGQHAALPDYFPAYRAPARIAEPLVGSATQDLVVGNRTP